MQLHIRRLRAALRPTALASLALIQGMAWALPQNPTATFGQTQVSRPDASTLRIDQSSARAGIDWSSFSIGAGETVRVVQPGSTSLLVNRVNGLDPSLILGRLQANGQVFLTNPRGVIFGAGAQVDVGALVATTLRLGDADAQAGRLWLRSDDGAAEVVNNGQLRAPGGSIVLVAPRVINRGTVDAARVGLAAVAEVQVDLDGDGLILFNARAADAARLDQLGRITADGGRAELIAAARGQVAGTVLNLRGAVLARGLASQGGQVVIDGGTSGIVEVAAGVDVSAAAGHGGDLLVLGQKILLDTGTRLDAQGRDGGGQIRVGGDFQGSNPALHNAEALAVRPGVVLDASAVERGNGGTVVLWSDGATRFFGAANARGGRLGGDGGRVEVSGKQFLDYRGSSDRSAPAGRSGALLLDPTNLEIVLTGPDINGGAGPSGEDLSSGTLLASAPGTNSLITAAAVESFLLSGPVQLQASNNLTVSASINNSNPTPLTLEAGNSIAINAPISTQGNLILSAGEPAISGHTTTGQVSVNASISSSLGLTISNNGGIGSHLIAANVSAGSLTLTGDAALSGTPSITVFSDSTIASVLSGSGGFSKAGPGMLTLSGANTYQGSTTVSDGTLRVSNASGLGSSIAGTVVFSGAALEINGVNIGSEPLALSGSGASGNGALVATGNASGSGPLTLIGDATIGGTGSLTLSGVISESGSLVALSKAGSGTLTLAGSNSFSGGVAVSAGSLSVGNSLALGPGQVGLDNGTTLDLVNGSSLGNAITLFGNATLANSSGLGGLTSLGSIDLSSHTLTLNSGGTGLTLNGHIAGSGTLVMSGGSVTLGGANAYTGSTLINAGSLVVDNASALGTAAGGTVVASGATLEINNVNIGSEALSLAGTGVLAAGALVGTGAGAVVGGPITLTANTSIGGTGSLLVGGAVGGAFGFRKVGAGTLTLSGVGANTGTNEVAAGTLVLGAADRLANASSLVVSGGNFNLGGFAETVASVQLTGGGSISDGFLTSASAFDLRAGTVSAVLAGAVGLNKTTAGTVTLSGANAYTGATTISGGSLALGADNVIADASALTVNGATLDIGSRRDSVASVTLLGNGSIVGSSGVLSSGTAFDLRNGTVSAILGGTAGINKTTAGTVTLSGANTVTGTTTVAAGTLALAVGSALSASDGVTVASGATLSLGSDITVASLVLAGTLSGSSTLTAATYALAGGTANANLGPGILLSTGSSALNGTSAAASVGVDSGTLSLGSADRLADTAAVSVAAGATLQLNGNDTIGSLNLLGQVTGVGLLNVGSFTLTGGTYNADISASLLINTGISLLNGLANASVLQVPSGTLTFGAAGRMSNNPAVTVDAGATLALGGNEAFGSLAGAGQVNLGSATLSTGSANTSTTFSGLISGSGSLQKVGSGSFTLSAANNYGGGTTVQGGTLVAQGAAASLGSGAVTLASGAVLDLVGGTSLANAVIAQGGSLANSAGSGSLTGALTLQADTAISSNGTGLLLAGVIDDGPATFGITKSGSSNVTLTANNLYGGITTISAGTLAIGNGGTSGTLGSGTVVDNGTLLFKRSDAITVANNISGSGNVLLAGGGAVSLTGNNSYTGGTSATGGKITFDGPGAASGGGSITLDGSTLDIINGASVGASVTSTAGTLSNSAGLGTLTGSLTLLSDSVLDSQGTGLVISGVISGTGAGITKTGTGPVTLSGANNYSGATLIPQGTLALGADNALPSQSAVTVTGGTLDLRQFNTSVAALSLVSGSILGSGQLTSAAGFALQSGSVSAGLAGSGGVSKSSAGTVTLSGANSYSGATTVAAGRLVAGHASALGSVGQGTTVASGAVLEINDVNLGAEPLQLAGSGSGDGALLGTGANAALGGSVSLTADATVGGSGNLRLGGVIGDGGASLGLTKAGAGTLSLAAANTYRGATQVGAGTLALGTTNAVASSSAVVVGGGTLDIGSFSNQVTALQLISGTVAGSSGVLSSTADVDARSGSIGAVLGGAAGLVKTGAGTVTLSASNTFSGLTSVNEGALLLGTNNALTSPLTVNAGTLDLGVFSSTVSAVTLAGGSIAGSSGVLASRSDFDLRSGSVTAALGGAVGLRKTGNGSVTLSAANRYSGATQVQQGSLLLSAAERLPDTTALQVATGATLRLGGDETVASAAIAGAVDGGQRLIAATYALNNAAIETGLGGGTLTSVGNSTLNGLAAVSSVTVNTGTLALGSAGRLAASPTLSLANGATLALGGDETVGAFSGRGNVALGTATLRVDSAASTSFDGQLTGSGGLTKQGTGTLTLTAAQTYAGSTSVLAGKLLLPSPERLPDNAPLLVASGATLLITGSETVGGLRLGGTLDGTAAGIGTLNAPSYALEGGTAMINLGAGALTSSGSSRLSGTSAATTVAVTHGVLDLSSAQRLANSATVNVTTGATLRLNGDQTLGSINLGGTLTGLGTLSATSYALNSGSTVNLPLGSGTLDVTGSSTLNTVTGATNVNINGGTLTVGSNGDLADNATVFVQANATLAVTTPQTIGSLGLDGALTGNGTLSASSVTSSGTAATVLTTLQVADAVTVASGQLTVGNGATSGSLSAASTTVAGGATLAFNRSDQIAVGTVAGAGTLRQAGSGTVQLTGSAASISSLEVTAGNLALAGGANQGSQINDAANVRISQGATLTLGSAGESVASLTLAGRLAGSGNTLTANSYALTGGVADANLGAGNLTNSAGSSVLNGSAAVTSVTVTGGSLAVANGNALVARPGLSVLPGAVLSLTGNQVVGAVSNAGSLTTGAALSASTVDSAGAMTLGGSITSSGNQTYGGALKAADASIRPVLVAGGDIVALNPGNDFSSVPLAVQARSVQLFGGARALTVGALTLSGGSSLLSAGGPISLTGAVALSAGSLALESSAAASDGAAALNPSGSAALLPDPANGAASGTRLLYAAPVISQAADAAINTATGSVLRLRAPGAGAIDLSAAGNQINGTVSAVSGPADTPFVLQAGAATARLSRITISADALHLVADSASATSAGGSDVRQALASQLAGPAATTGSDALRADVIQLAARSITAEPGAVIRARLPYSINQGPNSSLPALVIDTGPASAGNAAVFGTADQPLSLAIGNSILGIGGLYLSVLPDPKDGGAAGRRIYLACTDCSNTPVYQFGGDALGVLAYFNGTVLGNPPQSASAINNNTTLLENARRGLFESAVRTENVAPRLRAGVIAEVGKGRSATEGTGGARRPGQCEMADDALACAAAPPVR